MKISLICSACGAELRGEVISAEKAESRNGELRYFASDIHFEVSPCSCRFGDKNTIVKKLQETLKEFE